jgi:hypothetical protein
MTYSILKIFVDTPQYLGVLFSLPPRESDEPGFISGEIFGTIKTGDIGWDS